MVFPIKGENHHSGVKNEHDIISYLNNNKDCPINKYFKEKYNYVDTNTYLWEHRGGTTQCADCVLKINNDIKVSISIKNHKSGGTFDWKNTSKYVNQELKNKIIEYRDANLSEYRKLLKVSKKMRNDIAKILKEELDKFTSNNILKILKDIYKDYCEYILINDCRNKCYILLNKNYLLECFNIQLDELTESLNDLSDIDKLTNELSNLSTNEITSSKTLINKEKQYNMKYILKSSRALTSKQIFISYNTDNNVNNDNNNSESINNVEKTTNLRVRLVLNNGCKTLFEGANSKKKSIPCIKIQQENVKKFIANCSNKIVNPY
jgi:hypothetical protein